MNKYQEFYLDKVGIERSPWFGYISINDMENSKILRNFHGLKIDRTNHSITITQNKNPNDLSYKILISSRFCSAVEYYKNKNWTKAETSAFEASGATGSINLFAIPVDFKDKTTKIKLYFLNNIVDDLVLDVEYNAMTKEEEEAYYENERKKHRAMMVAKANINIRTGVDLVNIVFQPCDESYKSSKIQLFFVGHNNEPKVQFLIAEFDVEKEMMYKAISDLAPGLYAIKLIQFNDKNQEIFVSDEILFEIDNKRFRSYNLKPLVRI